jgi:uncharacterized membrane protein
MRLGEVSEARIRGYLFVLKRSLPAWLPAATVSDALRVVEGHIRERAEQGEAVPDERAALERILDHLGSPARVAAAYTTEMAVDEAVASGKILAMARALGRIAVSTAVGFFTFLGLFLGYGMGFSFLLMAVMKPIFPRNVGLFVVNGRVRSFGIDFPIRDDVVVRGGYWLIPLCLVLGLACLWVTHRAARGVLRRWQARRQELSAVSAALAPSPGSR